MKRLKIVVIGGGSSYTPELVEGIIQKEDVLPVSEIVLLDIEAGIEKVKINHALVTRMIRKAGLDIMVSYTLDRKEAFSNADFIMSQFRVGGLAARALDEQIPLKHGMIGQETVGMGGFFKALRTIPVMVSICEDIEDICPDAWLINFTNPSGIITEMVQTRTNVKCIGLCNVPINMHYEAAEKLGVSADEITSNFIGLNHLSFMNHCMYKGNDVLETILNTIKAEGIVKNIEKIEESDHLSKTLGLMLSPYLQYFYFEDEMLEEEATSFNSGEGSRAQQVMKVEAALFELYKDPNLDVKPKELEERGGARYSEAAISLVDAIYNDRGEIHVVNTLNNGSITDMPDDCVVEVNCVISKKGAMPIENGPLPKQVAGLVKIVKIYEQYTIEAALSGSREKAILALVNNPLVRSMEQGRLAFEELLEAHRQYLPQFVLGDN